MTNNTTNLNLFTYNNLQNSGSTMASYIQKTSGSDPFSNMIKVDEFSGSKTTVVQNITASAVLMSASIVVLDTPTGVVSGSYNAVDVNIYGRVTGGSVVETFGAGNGGLFFNKSGSPLYAGDVVIYEPKYDSAMTVSACLVGNPSICGVLYNDAPNDLRGIVFKTGIGKVNVYGNVAKGNWLTVSSASAKAQDTGSTRRPEYGEVGIALTDYLGGASGSVMADISIYPYTTASGLYQMPTITNYSANSSGSQNHFYHIVDNGTDLLVVRNQGSNATTSMWCSSGSMTPCTGTTTIYYFQNPSIGAHKIICDQSTGEKGWVATNYHGAITSGCPLRDYASYSTGGVTSFSKTLSAVAGDIVIDSIRLGASGWFPTGDSQILEFWKSTTTYAIKASYKIMTSGSETTTMSWAGSLGNPEYNVATIRGS